MAENNQEVNLEVNNLDNLDNFDNVGSDVDDAYSSGEEGDDEDDNDIVDRLDREQVGDTEDADGGDSQIASQVDEEEYHALLFVMEELLDTEPQFQWEDHSTDSAAKSISGFNPRGNPGPVNDCPGESAIDYFNLFFDKKLLNSVTYFTNKHAMDCIASRNKQAREKAAPVKTEPAKKKVRTEEVWNHLTIEELQAYFGVLLLIELLYKDRLESLWSQATKWPLITPSGLTKVFTRDRFMEISRYLHFCDESKAEPRDSLTYDKLYKIRPFLQHLTKRFQEEYIPEQEVSIDECMVPFRGRLGFKQYCQDKPIKFGIKVFMLAESKSGYNFNFEVYTGKDPNMNMGLCSRVVISLLQPLYDQGYHVFTDRFYTSPTLLFYLSKLNTYGCGTVMANRKHFPSELKSTNAEMTRGEYIVKVCEKTGMVATVWCDKKPIYFLSNIHVPTCANLKVRRKDGKGKSVEVPATPSVSEYNKNMGGVDRNDNFASIDKSRKQYKWYRKLVKKGLMWSLFNAYIIEGNFVNHSGAGKRKRDFHSFCLDVAHQLIGDFSSRKRMLKSSSSKENHKRITTSDHNPIVTDSYDLRCVVCAEKVRRGKLEQKKKTSVKCSSENCNVPLCMKRDSTCWVDWHTKVEYWR